MKKLLTLIFLTAFSLSGVADEHGPATMKGEKIELFEMQHAFAGKINEYPIYAGFDHQPYGTTLVLRKNDKTLQTRLEPVAAVEGVSEGSKLLGVLSENVSADQKVQTKVSLLSLQRNEDQSALITYLVDDKNVTVLVRGESFENNHFIAPSFEATLADGERLTWKFSGQSCYGYSVNIAASILLANAHLKK